jgi:hypothetical protein
MTQTPPEIKSSLVTYILHVRAKYFQTKARIL